MKRLLAIASLLILTKFSAQTWNTEEQYIQRFAKLAVEEMEKYKIPASITLAQGLLETGGGQSRLAKEGNNHFGIKCKEEWTGRTMSHTDDAPNECFRVYNNPKESYEDHSKFLAYRKYYTNLFTLDMKDYKAWAHGLKKAGYATNPRYAYILISKIEKYRLNEFDDTNSKEVLYTILKQYPELQNDKRFIASYEGVKKQEVAPTITKVKEVAEVKPVAPVKYEKSPQELLSKILVRNHPNGGRKYVVIPANTDINFIANKFGIRESKLMMFNELERPNLAQNDIIFLESKANSGNVSTYKIKAGETMRLVSQKFGIKLHKLLAKNRMNEDDIVKAGELIYLQHKKPRS